MTLVLDTPAIVTGTSRRGTSGRAEPPSSTVIHPSIGTVARPPSSSGLPHRRVIGVQRAEPRPAGGAPAHRQHPRVVGVQDRPPAGARDPRDGRLHLRELVERPDAQEVEVVGGHVRHHRDVVVQDPDPAEQDAAPRRLEHRDVGVLIERRPRAAEPRVVALLDEVAVAAEHAVGRGVRDGPARRANQVREQADRGRLAVRPRHRDDRDPGVGNARLLAGVGGPDAGGRLRQEALDRAPAADLRHEVGDGARRGLGRSAVPPRERDHGVLALGAGAAADREPDVARAREALGDGGRQPGDGAPSLLGAGGPGPAVRPGPAARGRRSAPRASGATGRSRASA